MTSPTNPATQTIWQIDENDFPVNGEMAEKITFWLRYAILAPSAHNTQPWRVEIHSDQVSIFRDPEFTLKDSDATFRETFLGLGAFLENLIVAAHHWGYEAIIEEQAFTTADLLIAQLRFEAHQPAGKAEADGALFQGILKRHTNRGLYDSAPLESNLLEKLTNLPSEDETKIFWITEDQSRERIAELVGQATQMALSVDTMRRELAELVFREDEQRPVGMMVEALSDAAPNQLSGDAWVKTEMDPKQHGQSWREGFRLTPLHVIVGSRYDGPEAWLAAGRVMERVLLMAASMDLAHCISAGPIEVPTLLPLLRQEIDADYRPQALFRLGVPQSPEFTRHSTRRSVESIVN